MMFDLISGVSVGALNGALLAMNRLENLNYIWFEQIAKNGVCEVYESDFIDTSDTSGKLKFKLDWEKLQKRLMPDFQLKINPLKHLPLLFSKRKRAKFLEELKKDAAKQIRENMPKLRALADNTPLREKLEFYIDQKAVETTFLCGFVSLDSGEYHSVASDQFETNEDFINGVLASTAIPIVWEPVPRISFDNGSGEIITAHNNVDGGIKNVSPLGDVVKHINEDTSGAEWVVMVINCSDGRVEPKVFDDKNIGQIALRSLNELAIQEIFNNDLSQFVGTNDLVIQAEAWDKDISLYNYSWTDRRRTKVPVQNFHCVVIEPDKGALGDTLVSTPEIFEARINHGVDKAHEAFKNVSD